MVLAVMKTLRVLQTLVYQKLMMVTSMTVYNNVPFVSRNSRMETSTALHTIKSALTISIDRVLWNGYSLVMIVRAVVAIIWVLKVRRRTMKLILRPVVRPKL